MNPISLLYVAGFLATGALGILRPHPSTSRMYGPGLQPHLINLPCRYFFVELYDEDGNRFEMSPGIVPLEVKIVARQKDEPNLVPVRHDQMDMEDGTYIVRYKLFTSFQSLEIRVKLLGKHILGSPVKIDFPVHPSGCECPQQNFQKWFEDFGCDESDPQIEEDLKPFPSIDMEKVMREVKQRFPDKRTQSFCHYVVKNNEVFRECFGEHIGFKMFPDSLLSYFTRIVKLPDVEFLINLGDWPLISKDKEPAIPMISWCKDNHTHDILWPTYEITEASLECMGRQSLDMLSVLFNTRVPWHEREEKGFFRGRDSSKERLELVRLAKKYPDLIDAGITRYFFFRDHEEDIGKVNRTLLYEFFNYKYQINMDGTVAAYRFPYLMAGGSLILKQQSKYYEHFYKQLVPYEHFVPFSKDVSDLVQKIKWAMKRDNEAEKIAKSARQFAEMNLLPQKIICYHALVLKNLSKRLKHKPRVTSQMDKVDLKHFDHAYVKCDCNLKQESTSSSTKPPREEL